MTTLMTDESIQRQARLHVLRLEYIRAFGKPPPGGAATDAAWLSNQLDHADEVKRANRLCTMIGEARKTKAPFRVPTAASSPVRFMTHAQILSWLERLLAEAQAQAQARLENEVENEKENEVENQNNKKKNQNNKKKNQNNKNDNKKKKTPPSSPSSSSSSSPSSESSPPSPMSQTDPDYVPRIDPHAEAAVAPILVRGDSSASSSSSRAYEFEAIVGRRVDGGIPMYRVLWTNGERTWEPIESFDDPAAVLRYEAETEAARADCGGRIQLPVGGEPYCTGVAQALGLERPTMCERHRALYEADAKHPSKRARRAEAQEAEIEEEKEKETEAQEEPLDACGDEVDAEPPLEGLGDLDLERPPLQPTNLEARFAAVAAETETNTETETETKTELAEATAAARCYVCLGDHIVAETIACSGEAAHPICDHCLEHMVASWALRDGRDREALRADCGKLTCQMPGCGAEYLEQDVAQHATKATFDKYIANRLRLAAARAETAANEQHQAQLVGAATETLAEQIGRMRLDVLETVVASRCPECKMHFDGFQGCFVLHCDGLVGVGPAGGEVRRVGCGAYFCAWCHEAFETDAEGHEHLLGSRCLGVLPVKRRSRQFKGRLYGSDRDYQTATKERRKRLLREYLAQIESASVRAALLVELKDDLRGVVPSNFYSDLYPRRPEAETEREERGHKEAEAAPSSEDEECEE